MDKIGDWLNSVPLFGIAGISFAVGILYGKGLPCLEWETLIAGCLGLAGGAFALVAMKAQIAANEKSREADINREETLNNEHYYALINETAYHLHGFAKTMLHTLKSDKWLNQDLFKSTKNILAGIPIPPPPLTAENDIRNTVYGMMFTRSKIENMMTEFERDIPEVNKRLEENKNIRVLPPEMLIDQLHNLRAYGAFLLGEIEDITREQGT